MKNYNQLVHEHFFKSPYVGELPAHQTPVSVQIGQGSDSDRLQLHLKFNTQNIIVAARFKAYGNPYTIAAGSLLCELIQGLNLQKAKSFTHKILQDTLEIPITRRHSALLAEQALQMAIGSYERGLVCTI